MRGDGSSKSMESNWILSSNMIHIKLTPFDNNITLHGFPAYGLPPLFELRLCDFQVLQVTRKLSHFGIIGHFFSVLHKRLYLIVSIFFLFLCGSAFIFKPKTYKVQSYFSTCSAHEIPEVNPDTLMLLYFIKHDGFRRHELHPVTFLRLSSFWCTLKHQYVIKRFPQTLKSQPTPSFLDHVADSSNYSVVMWHETGHDKLLRSTRRNISQSCCLSWLLWREQDSAVM